MSDAALDVRITDSSKPFVWRDGARRKVIGTCRNCPNPVYRKERLYCSVACYSAVRIATRLAGLAGRKCESCGVALPVTSHRKTCSISCGMVLTVGILTFEQRQDLKQMVANGAKSHEVAAHFGLRKNQIGTLYRRLNLVRDRPELYTPEQDAVILAMMPTYEHIDRIVEAVNACEGPRTNRGNLLKRASRLGVRRPADFNSVFRKGRPKKKSALGIKIKRNKAARPKVKRFVAPPPPPAPPPPTPPEPRGAPGIALPPIAKAWPELKEIALRQGRDLRAPADLIGWNKTRIAQGFAPYAVHLPAGVRIRG